MWFACEYRKKPRRACLGLGTPQVRKKEDRLPTFRCLELVTNLVGHGLFAIGSNLYGEDDGAAIDLREVVAVLNHLPARPAIELFQYRDCDGFLLVVAKFDAERFFVNAVADFFEVGLCSLAHDVERIADVQSDLFVARRVGD